MHKLWVAADEAFLFPGCLHAALIAVFDLTGNYSLAFSCKHEGILGMQISTSFKAVNSFVQFANLSSAFADRVFRLYQKVNWLCSVYSQTGLFSF